jgi:predicted dehydrogenase
LEATVPARKTIGVIGLGSIGSRHARNLVAMGHRVYGYDVTLGEAIPGVIHASTVNPLRKNCEALIIALPSAQHCVEFIESPNIPILIEKPIGIQQGDFYTYQMAFRERSAPVMVGNNLRFHSCVKKAKEWLAEGLIGKPLWASFCVAQHNTKYTDPVVLNWGAHEIDLALYLLGPATVMAAAGNDQIMDMCLLHEYGVPSTIHGDYVTQFPPNDRHFMIQGDKSRITVDLVSRTAFVGRNDVFEGGIIHCGGSWDQDYKDEIAAFTDLIDGKPVPHAATGQDGLACLELILEAQRMANASA